MAFDFQRFFEQHRIEFARSGANTSRNNVSIHCPFCGTADPSKHMSVAVNGKGWRCWRHPQHRGKNATRLVQALLGCDWERAAQITGESKYVPTDFLARIRGAINPPEIKPREGLDVPKEFRRFEFKPSSRPFEEYLIGRGYTEADIETMSSRYGMRYCTSGAYRYRVVFLIRYMDKLVAWTGRHIGDSELRYKTLSVDEEKATQEGYKPALGAVSHYLLWWDRLQNVDADTLIICEGPFDALKVDVLGRRHGIAATCFFTSAPTEAQVALLHELCPQFKTKILLLDRGTLALAMRINSRLSGLGIKTREVPFGLKDPGLFTASTFKNFALSLPR